MPGWLYSLALMTGLGALLVAVYCVTVAAVAALISKIYGLVTRRADQRDRL